MTIVRDGMPFISRHYEQFQKLSFPWHWSIVEGTANNSGSTGWCRKMQPGSSKDGTTGYIHGLTQTDKRISARSRAWWEGGKDEMCNIALKAFTAPGILLQVDADEMWSAETLERLWKYFHARQDIGIARFRCRYFVGPDIITVGDNCYGNYRGHEWTRAWRWSPGMEFKRHEPPQLNRYLGRLASRETTMSFGLTFDHFAYATEAQVKFKELFYNYPGAVEQWRRLQENKTWPTKLKPFLPWVDDAAVATKIDLICASPDKTKPPL